MTGRPSLKNLIEFASASAEKLFRKTGEVLPVWHAVTADGETIVLMCPEFLYDKDLGAGLIKAAFELNHVDSYVFISEAWALTTSTGEPPQGSLEYHPDRREIIAFSAENRKGEMQTAKRYILRPEHGKAKLSPLLMDDMTKITASGGRVVGMLRWR